METKTDENRRIFGRNIQTYTPPVRKRTYLLLTKSILKTPISLVFRYRLIPSSSLITLLTLPFRPYVDLKSLVPESNQEGRTKSDRKRNTFLSTDDR